MHPIIMLDLFTVSFINLDSIKQFEQPHLFFTWQSSGNSSIESYLSFFIKMPAPPLLVVGGSKYTSYSGKTLWIRQIFVFAISVRSNTSNSDFKHVK